MDEEAFTSTSYGVRKKGEGINGLLRWITAIGFILFSVGYCLLFTIVLAMPAVIAILPVLWLIFIPFFKRQLRYEIECTVEQSRVRFEKFYDNKKRKTVLALDIHEATKVRPLGDLPKKEEYDTLYDLRGSVRSPDGYLLLYRDGEKRIAVLFEATRKIISLMSYYNKDAVTVSRDLTH